MDNIVDEQGLTLIGRYDVPEGLTPKLLGWQTAWIQEHCGCKIKIRNRKQWGVDPKVSIWGPEGDAGEDAWTLRLLCLWPLGEDPPENPADFQATDLPAAVTPPPMPSSSLPPPTQPAFIPIVSLASHTLAATDFLDSDDEIAEK